MVKTIIVVAGIVGWSTSAIFVAATATHRLSAADKAFVTATAIRANYELRAAKVAQRVAPTDSAQGDARFVILDETKLADDLRRATARTDPSFNLPSGIDRAHQVMLTRLQSAGNDFQAEYARQMMESHLAMRTLARQYLAQGDASRAIKSVVSSQLPTFEIHLQMAKALAQRLESNRRSPAIAVGQ